MKTLILFIVLAFALNAQFRDAVFLHHSVGSSIYGANGSDTDVMHEAYLYNLAHSYTGTDSVQMRKVYFPYTGGNDWYEWHQVMDSSHEGSNIYPYLDTNKIIIIKSCYFSSDMGGIGVPSDSTRPQDKTVEVYKWHWREMSKVMATHPNNFFVIWTNAPRLESETTAPFASYSDWFCTWAKDTLAAGLDATYGAFPDNIFVFDFFHEIDSSNYMPLSLAVSAEDNHPNAAGTELIAPIFVGQVFDAAIAYENGGKWLRSSNGRRIFSSDGKSIIMADE